MNTQIQHGESEKSALLIGATGVLGDLIARALLDRGAASPPSASG